MAAGFQECDRFSKAALLDRLDRVRLDGLYAKTPNVIVNTDQNVPEANLRSSVWRRERSLGRRAATDQTRAKR